MNQDSYISGVAPESGPASPILVIPYMWIGDFVRAHSAVRLLKARWPARPVDFLTTALCAPLLDYMPGLRKGIVQDLPRGSLPLGQYRALAGRLRAEGYGTAIIMPRTWKAALAPFLAGIPERTGFFGEARLWLVNDMRFGERALPRMIDCFGALALPKGAPLPADWPLPQIVVPEAEVAQWRQRHNLPADGQPVVAMAPGAVGPGKAWPPDFYAELAGQLAGDGVAVWVLGGPKETPLAATIAAKGGEAVRDLTGNDLRNAIVALRAASAAVTNDSGLMHISAAIGTPTVAIFGPTSPALWAPLNPLAAVLEPEGPCSDIRARNTREVGVERVYAATRAALGR
jgi:heptosyltransferase-2